MTRPPTPHLPGLGDDTGARVARVRRYVDRQLRAQRAMGQIEPVDAGLVGLAMTAADAIDRDVADPDVSSFTLYRGIDVTARLLLELRGERRDSAGDLGYDDELARLTAEIRDAARSRASDHGPVDPGPPDPSAP